MFAIEITSFASSSRAAAFGCGGAAVAAGAALSLHDRSANARKTAVLGRIGARKIAKPGRLYKRRVAAAEAAQWRARSSNSSISPAFCSEERSSVVAPHAIAPPL